MLPSTLIPSIRFRNVVFFAEFYFCFSEYRPHRVWVVDQKLKGKKGINLGYGGMKERDGEDENGKEDKDVGSNKNGKKWGRERRCRGMMKRLYHGCPLNQFPIAHH